MNDQPTPPPADEPLPSGEQTARSTAASPGAARPPGPLPPGLPPQPQPYIPPATSWYNGPYPPPGLGPNQESLGRVALRSGIASCVIVAGAAFGLVAALGIGMVMLIATIGAAAGASDNSAAAQTRLGATEFVDGSPRSKNSLLVVEVNGLILGEQENAGGLFNSLSGVTYGYDVRDTLLKAAKDNAIKGVILEMNTPGGTIFGAQAIADGVRAYREQTGKPVLAFVKGLSASGGMWAMAPANRILADYGSIIGSIGVILGPIAFYDGVTATDGGILGGGVTTRNGIEYTNITAGRGKDMGSPYRRLTDEERTVLQTGVNNSYNEFVRHIAATRNLSEDVIRNQIGALIYDNQTAQSLGLIDGTAGRRQAYEEAARLANLSADDWKAVRVEGVGGIWSALLGAAGLPAPAAAPRSETSCLPPNMVLAYYGDPASICRRP